MDPFCLFWAEWWEGQCKTFFFFNAIIKSPKVHKEVNTALHESGNYVSVMFSTDTTNKESGTKLNNYYINVLLQWYVTEQYSNNIFFFSQMPPRVLTDLVVLPPGHGSSVTDFWGWDAYEAQLRCPDDVSGDIGGWSARRALKPKFY